jgi:hypothetical protein
MNINQEYKMLKLDDLPPVAQRLAAACLVWPITAQQVMHMSAEDAALFAADAGLSFDEFLQAIAWLSAFWESNPPRTASIN